MQEIIDLKMSLKIPLTCDEITFLVPEDLKEFTFEMGERSFNLNKNGRTFKMLPNKKMVSSIRFNNDFFDAIILINEYVEKIYTSQDVVLLINSVNTTFEMYGADINVFEKLAKLLCDKK